MEVYPKKIHLKDKTSVLVRPLVEEDLDDVVKFFSKIPRSDLLIYKDDVVNTESIESWFTSSKYNKTLQLVTIHEDKIIAKGTLHKEGLYWTNATELKLIVDPGYRGKGLGTQIFNILLYEVIERRFQKVLVRYTPDNNIFLKIINRYGFKPESVLRYYLEEESKVRKDLIVASYNLEDWSRRFEYYGSIFSKK